MARTSSLAAALLAAAALAAVAADAPKHPVTPPPTFATVAKIKPGAGEIVYQECVIVPVYRTELVLKNGKEVPVTTVSYETLERQATVALKDVTVQDAKGNELKEDEVWKRAIPGKVVLIARGAKKVDPIYLQIVKEDALIFILPPPKEVPPMPLPAPEPKKQ